MSCRHQQFFNVTVSKGKQTCKRRHHFGEHEAQRRAQDFKGGEWWNLVPPPPPPTPTDLGIGAEHMEWPEANDFINEVMYSLLGSFYPIPIMVRSMFGPTNICPPRLHVHDYNEPSGHIIITCICASQTSVTNPSLHKKLFFFL